MREYGSLEKVARITVRWYRRRAWRKSTFGLEVEFQTQTTAAPLFEAVRTLASGTFPNCLFCQCAIEIGGHRRCPVCAQEFTHGTWGGIDGHWRRYHANVMTYEQFRRSVCRRHWKWQ